MLVSPKAMLKKQAVCAFNVYNMETIQAVISAAVKQGSPVILQTSEKAIKYAGTEYLSAMMKIAAKAPVPVAIHLDHGKSAETVRDCLKAGYNSVMIDGSALPYEQNIRLTKTVVRMARGISVEAELGTIGGNKKIFYTDPEQAKDFVKKTSIDSLAVAIGTKHGLRKGVVKIRYGILKQIKENVNIPLVLHGSSGLSKKEIKKCIKLGVTKFNFDSDLRRAFMHTARKNSDKEDPREVLGYAKMAVEKVAMEKIKVCR